MPWKLGSRRIAYDVPFTNESTGQQYPANWMRKTPDKVKRDIGMIWEEPVATNYDQRFYWSADNPKQLDDVTDEEGNTTTGLKTLWKANQSQIAGMLIAPSDWRVIKAKETGSNMPAAWKTYRAAVRTACNTRQAEIDACSDVAALKELLFGDAQVQQTDDDGNPVMIANPALATAWPELAES
ncbi:hypothetical protein [uncultured Oceanicoccus sp.]|uniref:hypothetical protein n=1 Tax=uncultured Oceanicoccus sp. TaxID=1706381 RepID=UPI0030DCE4BD